MKLSQRILLVAALLILTPLVAYAIGMVSGNSVEIAVGWTALFAGIKAFIGFIVAIINSLLGEYVYAKNKKLNPSLRFPFYAYTVIVLAYLILLLFGILQRFS